MRFAQFHVRAASGDGGISNSVRHLAAAVARAGAEATIVCDDDGPAPSLPGVEWRRVRHRHVGGLTIPRRLDDAFRDADVVVLNSAWTSHNVAAGRAARRVGVPYVLAPRGAFDPRIVRRRRMVKRLWWTVAERDLVQRARAIHIFFPDEAEHLRALGYGGDVVVAPNGVDAPDQPRWHGAGGFLLYIGRFDPEHKGLDMLVRSVAASMPGQLPPVRLHGPDWRGGKDRVRALIRDLALDDRVTIGDAVYGDDKWSLMASAAAFVYPSRWEGFGNAPAEAAALGVPTVVTPYPLGTYLAGRGAAILAERTPEALALALQRAVSPEGTRCGANAADLVRREFGWDTVARSWLAQVAAWS